MPAVLRFDGGTLSLDGVDRADPRLPRGPFEWDPRTACFRAPAMAYALWPAGATEIVDGPTE